ncbi:FtsB family cell division protein [Thalassolituus sp. LLYu03]|uniref:FtsB family cell division protein n=1 Tax=Thalassolituus sp. LLYu03 TaxID=3421656 RepID=UPI003D274DAC
MTDKLAPHLKLLLMIAVPVLLLLILQYRIWLGDAGVVSSRALEQKIAKLHQDNDVQQGENDSLMAEVDDLRSGTSLLEEKAREELGLVRQGESFILFVDPEPARKP